MLPFEECAGPGVTVFLKQWAH